MRRQGRIHTGAIALALTAAMAFAAPAGATVVTNENDSGDGSLRQEIIDTPDGGVVTFNAGVDPTGLDSPIVFSGKDLTIRGNGPGATTISDSDHPTNKRLFVLVVNGSLRLENLTIKGFGGLKGDEAEDQAGGAGGNGGAIANLTTLTLDNVRMELNHAGNGGQGDLAPVPFAGGDGGSGGAIASTGTLTVRDSVFVGNSAGSGGTGGNGTAAGAGGGGGAVFSTGATILEDSHFELNNSGGSLAAGGSTFAREGSGGAIQLAGDAAAQISGSTFFNNLAGTPAANPLRGDGGAIHSSGQTMLVVNSTFSANKPQPGPDPAQNGRGGAIHAGDSTNVIVSSTITANGDAFGNPNVVRQGGGVSVSSDSIFIVNSILSDNNAAAGAQCHAAAGATLTVDRAMTWPTAGGCPSPIVADPGIALTYGANGGPTNTFALPASSPAVDAVPLASCQTLPPAPLTVDQRGLPRPSGPGCDLGSFELQQPPSGTNPGTATTTTPPKKGCKKFKKGSKKWKKCKKKKKS